MSPVLFPLRLKKKSQSVDIVSQGFAARLIPSLSLNRSSPPVAKTTTSEVQENNTTNSQRLGPRCSNLRRGYTIGKCLQYGRLCVWVFLSDLMSFSWALSVCVCVCMHEYVHIVCVLLPLFCLLLFSSCSLLIHLSLTLSSLSPDTLMSALFSFSPYSHLCLLTFSSSSYLSHLLPSWFSAWSNLSPVYLLSFFTLFLLSSLSLLSLLFPLFSPFLLDLTSFSPRSHLFFMSS